MSNLKTWSWTKTASTPVLVVNKGSSGILQLPPILDFASIATPSSLTAIDVSALTHACSARMACSPHMIRRVACIPSNIASTACQLMMSFMVNTGAANVKMATTPTMRVHALNAVKSRTVSNVIQNTGVLNARLV